MPGGEWAGGSGIRLTSIYSDARPSNIRIRLTSIKTPNAKQVSTCREESGQAVAAATQAAEAARQCRFHRAKVDRFVPRTWAVNLRIVGQRG